MKILIISQDFPYPPSHSGSKLKLYNLLNHLSKKNEIYLISFVDSEDELKFLPMVKTFCTFVATVLRKSAQPSLLRRFFSKYPQEAADYLSDEMRLRISEALKTYNIDVVHVDLIYMAQYISEISAFPKIISPNDVGWLLRYDLFKFEKNLIKKFKNFIHYIRVKKFEIDYYRKFDHCAVVSPKDAGALHKYLPNLPVSIIANGVDFDYFKPISRALTSGDLIFTGIMSYKPNIDAMLYFCGSILPLIEEKISGIKLYIVGKDPAEQIERLAINKNIIVTGYVEDIRTYMGKALVYVCPLRMGSGIKNKVLEAMAMGMPTVATPLSIEGIEVVPGRDIIVAGKPQEFADKVVELINSEAMRDRLVKNARKVAEKNYSWDSIAAKYEKTYENIIGK